MTAVDDEQGSEVLHGEQRADRRSDNAAGVERGPADRDRAAGRRSGTASAASAPWEGPAVAPRSRAGRHGQRATGVHGRARATPATVEASSMTRRWPYRSPNQPPVKLPRSRPAPSAR